MHSVPVLPKSVPLTRYWTGHPITGAESYVRKTAKSMTSRRLPAVVVNDRARAAPSVRRRSLWSVQHRTPGKQLAPLELGHQPLSFRTVPLVPGFEPPSHRIIEVKPA